MEDTTGAIKEGLKYCNADEVANNKGSGYNTLAKPVDWNVLTTRCPRDRSASPKCPSLSTGASTVSCMRVRGRTSDLPASPSSSHGTIMLRDIAVITKRREE